MPHLLITSLSHKVSMVRCALEAVRTTGPDTKVVGFDCHGGALGRFFVDEFHVIPPDRHLTLERWLELCEMYQINRIIPSRDGELSFFAENRHVFSRRGVEIMVSSQELIESCQDKLAFSQRGQALGLPVIPAFKDPEGSGSGKWVVKERFGSGSRAIGLNLSKDEALQHGTLLQDPIYQPFIRGQEYTVDAYVTREGHLKGMIPRLREQVDQGESQVTTSVRDPKLEEVASHFFDGLRGQFPFFGHVLIQMIKDLHGKIHIIECNPRFGGASHLSVACGLNSFTWFLAEANGEVLNVGFHRVKGEKRLIRYPEDWIQEVL